MQAHAGPLTQNKQPFSSSNPNCILYARRPFQFLPQTRLQLSQRMQSNNMVVEGGRASCTTDSSKEKDRQKRMRKKKACRLYSHTCMTSSSYKAFETTGQRHVSAGPTPGSGSRDQSPRATLMGHRNAILLLFLQFFTPMS